MQSADRPAEAVIAEEYSRCAQEPVIKRARTSKIRTTDKTKHREVWQKNGAARQRLVSVAALPQVRVLGRTTGTDVVNLFWTGSGIEFIYTGSEIQAGGKCRLRRL